MTRSAALSAFPFTRVSDDARDVSPDGQNVLFLSDRLGFGNDLYILYAVPGGSVLC